MSSGGRAGCSRARTPSGDPVNPLLLNPTNGRHCCHFPGIQVRLSGLLLSALKRGLFSRQPPSDPPRSHRSESKGSNCGCTAIISICGDVLPRETQDVLKRRALFTGAHEANGASGMPRGLPCPQTPRALGSCE